jgi:hypothetical protein
MKKIAVVCACLLALVKSMGQQSPYGTGLIQQPNAASARNYLGITGGGPGTVTSFSSGNLFPLFTTFVATPGTTPAQSFAQVSQNQNLVFASPNGAPGVPTFRALVSADIPAAPRTSFTNHSDVVPTTLNPGDIIAYNGAGAWTNGPQVTAGGSGTVTSFSAGTLSPLFTTSVANPTTTPALSFAQVSQNANLFFASPDGVSGNPSFRAIVAADVPRTPFTNHSDVVPSTLQPGDLMAYNGAGSWTNGPRASGGGSVTSVALSAPQAFSVSGSPVTTSGTLTFARANDDNYLGFGVTNAGNVITTNLQAQVITNTGTASAPFVYTDSGGKHKTGIVGLGLTFDSASGTLSNSNPNQVSLPGLLVRPVSALVNGTLQAPTFPDDDTYYFDEEFDSAIGTTAGQFGKNYWNVVAAGGGGGASLGTSNEPPHYGVAVISSPTGATSSASFAQTASSLLLPYPQLGLNPNWLFHAVFRIATTNQGSIYRIGLSDTSFSAFTSSISPSNCVMLRWDKNKNDPNNFVFEACSNSIRSTANSTVRPNTNNWVKLTMMSTNAGTVLCSVNGESWVTLTTIPVASMFIVATTAVTNAVQEFLWLDRLSFMASSTGR